MTVVVVGGGIAGMVSALLLSRTADSVCLVEKEDRPGGLYRSFRNETGLTFDCGTHLLRQTGIEELDDLLCAGVKGSGWKVFETLHAGGYFGGVLNSESPFVDATRLPTQVYQQGMMELLERVEESQSPSTLAEQLQQIYGSCLTANLFEPILHKYYGCSLDSLLPNAHHVMGLARILGFTPSASREIKKSSAYDGKIGFHSFREGAGNLRSFYPATGGVESWIELLRSQMQESGNIVVRCGESVRQVEHDDRTVRQVQLQGGETIGCSHLVWSVPAALLLKACQADMPGRPPQVRLTTHLLHFAYDRPFLTEAHYVHCHEPSMRTFRVTLYPNMQGTTSGSYHLTAEVLSTLGEQSDELLPQVQAELKQMGIVATASICEFSKAESLPGGFPLPTPELQASLAQQTESASRLFENVTLLGRATGKHFLTGQVLTDVFHTISSLPRTYS
jgi:protoporphyrinogen oxidase